ncbi:hypothetical protein QBC47DRAFT_97382 [Echria macrotheca]|uniref:Uncharacterized protein n=1 Tax=Echria macrotheca TaxID=438768 RepID=A0AAJ0BJA1_9PEZI|nr:hypothetical protein QBC47DRAFT_97382 [Echria macrotheca]
MRFTIRLGISLLSLFGSSASISSPPPSKRQQQQQVVIMAYNNNNPLPSTLLSYDAQLALDVAQNGDFGHDNVQISDDALRIHWTLDAPSLETAFTVVDHGNLLDPRDMPEPYFLGSDDQGKPKWHRYAASPFTTKPVASVRPAVDPLDNWEAFWEATHRVHYDPDWERSKEEPPVQICCGVARPTGKGSEVVVQGTGAPGGFVTVHDFLTTMHAYLMSRREDILEAMHMDLLRKRLGSEDIGSDTKLIVTPMTLMGVPSITVSTEKEWTRFNRVR